MASRLEVVNDGLVRLGVPPLASLADQGAQAIAADSIYQTVAESALAEHPWSFALREQRLPKLVIEEEDRRNFRFDFAYQLPGDRLRVLGLRSHDEYRLAGDQLYTNDRDAYVIYVANVDEAQWPSYFSKLVSFSFAASVAITLTEQTTRADLMYRLTDEQRRTARNVDSQQTPPFVFDLMRIYVRRTHNPLTSA